MSHHHAKLPAWYTLIGFSLFHQLIDQHCHVGQPPRVSKKMGRLPLFTLADSNSQWPQRGSIFLFFFFFTTEISYLIIGLWHLLEPIPLWRENSLCAAQLKPLQFVNLPLPVPGPPGGRAWCAVSDSESLHPRGQTTGWGRAIPRCLVQQAPKQGANAALAFHNIYLMCWHISGVLNSARGISVLMNPLRFNSTRENVQ